MRLRPPDLLDLPPDALARQCVFDTFRSRGPGGQHRNKTSSAVRATHTPTGIRAEADEHRSQQINREHAVARLRVQIALELRRPGDDAIPQLARCRNWVDTSPRAADYPKIVALVFDVLDAHTWTLFQAAERLGISTGQLSKFLTRGDDLLAAVNRHRQRLGMKPIGR